MFDNGGSMEESWLKLYRKITEWEWYTDSHMVHMFLHLLISANSCDRKWHGIVIKRGELVTSFASISESTGMSIQTIRTCIKKLCKTGEIVYKTNKHFTFITICKFDSYQYSKEDTNEPTTIKQQSINKQLTNQQRTDNNPLTTTKEYKNIRKITVSKETAIESQNAGRLVEIKKFFNSTLDKNNSAMPRIKSNIEGQRKAMLNARISEYGIDTVRHVIVLASQSDFLNGGGGKGFVANFEWIMRPNNFPKILDGNFNNKINNQQYGSESDNSSSERDDKKARYQGCRNILEKLQCENQHAIIDKQVRRPAVVPGDF
jgi:predicted transcriptional regulator